MDTPSQFVAWLCVATAGGLGTPAHDLPGRYSSPEPSYLAICQEPDHASFESALAGVQALIEKRSWKEAEAALRDLLVLHTGAHYVRPHLAGMRRDLQRAAFWKSVDEPDVSTLIDGELLRYSRTSDSVRVRYTSDGLADFEHNEFTYSHPMHFTDAWSIHLEGTPAELSGFGVLVSVAPGEGYLLQFGMHEKGDLLAFDHTAQRINGRKRVSLGSADAKERSSKRETVKAEISISRRAIQMKYDGRIVVRIDKPEDTYGSLVLMDSLEQQLEVSMGTIVLAGKIGPGWLGGLLDEAVSDQRAAFDAAWLDPEEFSSWSGMEGAEVEELTLAGLVARLQFLFVFESQKKKDLFDAVRATFDKGPDQAASTLAQIAGWSDNALDTSTLAYLRMSCALELDYPTLALEQLDRIEVAPEQELDRDLLRAELLSRGGRTEAAYEAFAALAQSNPSVALAHKGAAEALLLLARPEDAHQAILNGLNALPNSASLRELETKVVKASKGPSWKRVHEVQGRHFHVLTDVNKKTVRQASRVLEEAWERCLEFFGPLPPEALPGASEATNDQRTFHSVAYLFSGEASYLNYTRGVADPGLENTLGVYSHHLKQIAAWNQPDSEILWDTLRHEVAHRYLDLSMGPRLPRWLNEGLAECFAASWDSEGEYHPGGMRAEALATIRADPRLSPTREFMLQSPEAFMAKPELHYAQAWAFVHHLRYGPTSERKILADLLSALSSGVDSKQAVREAAEVEGMKDVQGRFVTWLTRRLKKL